MVMNIIRKIFAYISISIFPIALLTFGLLFSVNQVFKTPTHLKTDLAQSGVYDALVTNLVQQMTHGDGSSASQQSATGKAELQQAIKASLPDNYVKTQINGVLDGVYAWLNGGAAQPNFTIDLTQFHTNLISNVSAQAQKYATSLPACTSLDQVSSNFDPFGMSCLPPGVTPEQIAAETKQQLLTSDLFKNTVITPDAISKNEPLSKKLAPAKTAFDSLKIAVYVSAGLTILSALGAVFLSRPWRRGIRRISTSSVVTGSSTAILAIVGSILAKTFSKNFNTNGDQVLQGKIIEAARLINNDVRNWLVGFSLVIIVLGASALIALLLTKPKQASVSENKPKLTPQKEPSESDNQFKTS